MNVAGASVVLGLGVALWALGGPLALALVAAAVYLIWFR